MSEFTAVPRGNFGYKVVREGTGVVPEILKGMYTSPNEAMKDISVYVLKRDKPKRKYSRNRKNASSTGK